MSVVRRASQVGGLRARIATTIITGALVGGAVVATAPAASAAFQDCLFETSCLWTGENYTGTRGHFSNSVVLSTTNNKINSVYNNGRSLRASYYDNANHTGASITLNNPTRGGQCRDPKLSNGIDANPTPFHNRISSATFISG
ncbi:peptidase inhibitor family I36 protein [Cellulomonas triticagri]|uniref:Peptidase inhibitor family I36 protein n=1 Tax=Cellulomonas triticagri TaxID=2483352 RepID=A0A3M2J952_9CELL|nr:peptidase inhibitor family I36 protein [Cellulomonas triticagri]RMI07008.1 hypothetical protein EBM89_14215 [Cellulomonas triticagri]